MLVHIMLRLEKKKTVNLNAGASPALYYGHTCMHWLISYVVVYMCNSVIKLYIP